MVEFQEIQYFFREISDFKGYSIFILYIENASTIPNTLHRRLRQQDHNWNNPVFDCVIRKYKVN